MNIRIKALNGKSTIIVGRDREVEFSCKINHVSSTEEQPYIAINFDDEGNAVGGRTLQKSLAESIVETSRKNGFLIEEV